MDKKERLEHLVELMAEQHEILELVGRIREEYRGRGMSWNRFRGDAISRIVAHYLEKHLPEGFKVVMSAWVEGCEIEFDLLIVDKGVDPLEFTSAYPKDCVHLLIEVKGSGVFYKREEVRERLSKKIEKCRNATGKPMLYISIWEAKAHAKEVLEALGSDSAFIFEVEKEEINWTEWERLLEQVTALLKP